VAETRPVPRSSHRRHSCPSSRPLRSRAEVTFSYRGATRHVAPAALRFGQGRWYLVGWDLDREAAVHSGWTASTGRRCPDPPAVPRCRRASTRPEPPRSRCGRGRVTATTPSSWSTAIEAARASPKRSARGRWFERRPRRQRRPAPRDHQHRSSLRSWFLGLLDHAELLEPKELRDELVSWLDAIVTLPRDPDGALPCHRAVSPARRAQRRSPRARRSRRASTRLRRLLAIVSWLARVGAAPIAEVAQRFDIPPDELVRELELAACCGCCRPTRRRPDGDPCDR